MSRGKKALNKKDKKNKAQKNISIVDEQVENTSENQALKNGAETHEEALNDVTQTPGEELPEPSELDQLKIKLQDYEDRYLRSLADMENLKRRSDRERSDLLKYGMEGFFKDLMPVLDSFDKAIDDSLSNSDASTSSCYSEGMLMVKKQLFDILTKYGLQQLEAKGQKFDPNFHQAIQKVNADGINMETVGEEYAKGYTLNGRLLRASMVSVLVPNESTPAEE